MASLQQIQDEHNRYIDSLLESFERELAAIVNAAALRTQARLDKAIQLSDGKVARTLGNTRTLRRLDAIFLEEMDRAGYQHLLDELVSQFPGQLPYFQQTLETLSAAMKEPLPVVEFGPRDIHAFAAQAELSKDGIAAAMESIAARAKNRVMLSIGGSTLSDLTAAFAGAVSRPMPEVVGLAETATATYYRVIADRGYQILDQQTPGKMKYSYEGPLDKLTRPFCSKLLRTHRVFTRAQIDQMDNGQIPNVWISCGGWRCRHQWVLSTGGM